MHELQILSNIKVEDGTILKCISFISINLTSENTLSRGVKLWSCTLCMDKALHVVRGLSTGIKRWYTLWRISSLHTHTQAWVLRNVNRLALLYQCWHATLASLHWSHGPLEPGCRPAPWRPAKTALQWLNRENFTNDPSSSWLFVSYCKRADTGHTLRPWERLGLLLERCIIRTSLTWSAVHSWAGHTQSQSFPSSISLSLCLPSFLHGSRAHAQPDLL